MLTKSEKIIVLSGYIGSGKTSLFNKLCNAQQYVIPGGESATLQTFSKKSAYGKGFKLLDTPGLGAKSKKLAHACALMCGLTEGSISQIILVVKFERTALMMSYLKLMINGLYSKFKPLITVAVTHWDLVCNQSQSYIDTTKNQLIKEISLLNVHSTLFISQNNTGLEICGWIDDILSRCKAQKLFLTQNEFYANFDLVEVSDAIEDELNDAKEKCTVKFRKMKQTISKFIGGFSEENPNMPQVMHALTIAIKDLANELIEQFEKENNEKFSQLFENYNDVNMAYLIDVELKRNLMIEVNALMEQAQKKMRVSKQHCFNFIKKCPHCGEIWLKVSGCENETTCGNFPTSDNYEFKSQTVPKRYKFQFLTDAVKFEDLGEQKRAVIKTQYKDPGTEKRRGCGKAIDWKTIPALEPNLIKELLDPGILDYFAKEVEKKELQLKLQFDLDKKVQEQMEKSKIQELD